MTSSNCYKFPELPAPTKSDGTSFCQSDIGSESSRTPGAVEKAISSFKATQTEAGADR